MSISCKYINILSIKLFTAKAEPIFSKLNNYNIIFSTSISLCLFLITIKESTFKDWFYKF